MAPSVYVKLDAATGTCTAANEFGLAFIELGWETLDFAVLRDIYFHNIFQAFLEYLFSLVILKNIQKVRRIRLY